VYTIARYVPSLPPKAAFLNQIENPALDTPPSFETNTYTIGMYVAPIVRGVFANLYSKNVPFDFIVESGTGLTIVSIPSVVGTAYSQGSAESLSTIAETNGIFTPKAARPPTFRIWSSWAEDNAVQIIQTETNTYTIGFYVRSVPAVAVFTALYRDNWPWSVTIVTPPLSIMGVFIADTGDRVWISRDNGRVIVVTQ
jgi:hypothetical protein